MVLVADDPRAEIRKALAAWDLTPAWLARRIKESKQNVTNWLGSTSPSDSSIWDKMLDALPQHIVGEQTPTDSRTLMEIPMAGEVPAGTWGDPLESSERVSVDPKYAEENGRFLCKIVGDCCYPALHQGDTTVWQTDKTPPYGVIVLAQRSSGHECTVKELVFDQEARRARLMPINPQYEEADDFDGWYVVARLVGVIRNVDGLEKSWYIRQGIRARHLIDGS